MGLSARTRGQLETEGIATPEDLTQFDDDMFAQLVENLRKPGTQEANPLCVQDGNGNFPPNVPPVIPTPPFTLSAISLDRLKGAMELAKHHETCGRELTPANMQWRTVGVEFRRHWKILKDRSKQDPMDTPRISTRSLPVLKWVEAFHNFLAGTVGVRCIPLVHVIRPNAEVPAPPPLMGVGPNAKPYSEVHGSVEAELVARASHNHANHQEDNATVFGFVEEGTRGTSFAASVQPFSRRRDGRSALLAIANQHAGKDKWEAEMKKQESILHARKWKGNGSHQLDTFVAAHRNAFVMLTQCHDHVTCQLPNDATRVRYLLDNIECTDPTLLAAIANVRKDQDMVEDFEAAVAYILPSDPVAKRMQTAKGKRHHADISSVEGNKIQSGIGETGVELRHHLPPECAALSRDQQIELGNWRAEQKAKGVVFP